MSSPKGQPQYPGQQMPPQQMQYPPQGGAPPQYQAQAQPVQYAMQPPTVMVSPQPYWPHVPVRTICPHCSADVTTGIRKQSGLMTWLSCLGLTCIGCFFGCCLIPFVCDACKDTEHWCPNCSRIIARRDALSL